jgi:hypothetical protein
MQPAHGHTGFVSAERQLQRPRPGPRSCPQTARACQHAWSRAGGLHNEDAEKRRKNDQDLKPASSVPHLYTSFQGSMKTPESVH